jgi:hypothetical protein
MTHTWRCGLEQAFSLNIPPLREYMLSENPQVGISDDLGDRLMMSGHPIARMAAGWVAAELALQPPHPQFNSWLSYDFRQESLGNAAGRWQDAADDLHDYGEAKTSPRRKSEVFSMEIRMKDALAYTPIMEIGAALLAGEPLDDNVTDENRRTSRIQSAETASLLDISVDNLEMAWAIAGLRAELACGAVGQVAKSPNYLIMPASIRQDHHPDARERADYQALSVSAPHEVSLIQVTTREEHAVPNPKFLSVIANDQLVMGKGQKPLTTLRVFNEWANGTASQKSTKYLQWLSRKLMNRIDNFSEQTRLSA